MARWPVLDAGALEECRLPTGCPPLPALQALLILSSHSPRAASPGPPPAALSALPLPPASLRKGKAELPRAGGGLAAPVPSTPAMPGNLAGPRPALQTNHRAVSLLPKRSSLG